MSTGKVNLDEIVDYKAEYNAALEKVTISGDRITAICPFHDDHNASFTADVKTGKFTCFTCGAKGNYVTFVADRAGISTGEAFKQILAKYHIDEQTGIKTYTVADYAAEKRLPLDWLERDVHLGAGRDKDGTPWIKIPYFNADGRQVLFRKRARPGGEWRFKWAFGSAGKLVPYGEWRLADIKADGRCILCEGESDAQTLWHLGLPALGVPGASTFKESWTEELNGLALYLHIEPDRGGETFLAQMTSKLHNAGFTGKVYRFSCSEREGAKDPSALFIRDGEAAKAEIEQLLADAKPVDLNNLAAEIPEAIKGEPVRLRQPEGWIFSEAGISQIDPKEMTPKMVCRTPILLTKRLRSIETGDEKVEVAWKRDGEWHTATYPRSTIFTSRSIIALADFGCTVTSENAKFVVRFLEALEAENIDIIPRSESTSSFGWQSNGRFLPGHGGDLVLDIDPSMRGWAAAYCQNGTLERWADQMRPHRECDKFRFILAASFAAPLLQIIHQRIFMVYNWGGSKSGKTAGLKAALSAWGDPDKLMVNFNATQVALERMAGFYCDLPLGIDERQLAGSKQENLDKIIYMLSSGTGRVRGSKTGGMQAMNTWRTVCLSTGEEPISADNTMTGVTTRVLEIYGGPFEGAEAAASMMHQHAADNCGWAGPAFVGHVLQTGNEEILTRFGEMGDYLSTDGSQNSAHAAGIAAVATADALLSEWIFGEEREAAEDRARKMALKISADNAENDSRDVNVNAVQLVSDWITRNNKNLIGDSHAQECDGIIDGDMAYILPTVLKNALQGAGYSPTKTLKFMAEQELIASERGADKKNRFAPKKVVLGRYQRVIQVNLTALGEFLNGSGTFEEMPESEAAQETLPF
jgi:hypothetical protein